MSASHTHDRSQQVSMETNMSKASCFYVESVGAWHTEGRKHRSIQQILEDHVLILFYFENYIHLFIHSIIIYIYGAGIIFHLEDI